MAALVPSIPPLARPSEGCVMLVSAVSAVSAAGGVPQLSSLDLAEAIVVAIAALLVVAFIMWGAISASQHLENAVRVVRSVAVQTPTLSPTPRRRTLIDALAPSTQGPTIFVARIAARSGVPAKSFAGSEYFAAGSYSNVAARLDHAATLVVVPSAADATREPLEWQAPLTRTLAAARKAAPNASVLPVAPVSGDAQGGGLRSVRDVIHTYATTAKQHAMDGMSRHRGGTQIDSINSLPTVDAL